MSDYETFVLMVQDAARDVGKQFTDPDEDWLPTLLMQTEGDKLEVSMLPTDAFASPAAKELLARVLSAYLKSHNAKRYALLLSSWGLEVDIRNPEQREEVSRVIKENESIAEHSERVEMLVISTADKKEGVNLYRALILRDDEHPPGLGEWEDWSEAEHGGRFSSLL